MGKWQKAEGRILENRKQTSVNRNQKTQKRKQEVGSQKMAEDKRQNTNGRTWKKMG